MSQVHNPESVAYEALERLRMQVRELAVKRDAATDPRDRRVLERQLSEVEDRAAMLQRQLRP